MRVSSIFRVGLLSLRVKWNIMTCFLHQLLVFICLYFFREICICFDTFHVRSIMFYNVNISIDIDTVINTKTTK